MPGKHFRKRLVGTVLLLAAASPASPWAGAAVQDLTAMHDIIRDNHPGPVDAQNPGFHDWLDGGLASLLPQARAARSLHDYQTVMRDYANGFADGHLGVTMGEAQHLWPGFLVRADRPEGPVTISVVEGAPAGLHPGDVIDSCGGIPVRTLLKDRVLRPRLNPHVPQRLRLASSWLMVADADDPAGQWPDCELLSSGRRHAVKLLWRPITPAALSQARMRSGGIEVPATGLRQIGDVWLISMPSFAPPDDAAVAQLQTLVAQVRAQAVRLHTARHVVIDLRGNDGGDDAWGDQVAEALWGTAAVQAVNAAMPSVIDWRVSQRNASAIRSDANMMRAQNQAAAADYFDKLAGRMDHALARHDIFMRETGNAPAPEPHLVSPFAHPVDVLTTPHCASACLDFVDLLNGLPGTVRVGLETSSDTDYLDTAEAKLPSGHATLHYAMKVYRQRERGANVSYKPALAWPGGGMDDASIVRWINMFR
jgi:hypothetical protein